MVGLWILCPLSIQAALVTVAVLPEVPIQIATSAVPISGLKAGIPGLTARLGARPAIAKSSPMLIVVATLGAIPIPR